MTETIKIYYDKENFEVAEMYNEVLKLFGIEVEDITPEDAVYLEYKLTLPVK